MNVYIACALTHVPRDRFENYTNFIHEIANNLLVEYNAIVKYALRDSDPQLAKASFEDKPILCYKWDREMVEWADLVIADATYPSIGLGIELQIADSLNIPIILCFDKKNENKAMPVEYEIPSQTTTHTLQIGEGFISLMALGLPSVYRVVPYTDYASAIKNIGQVVCEIN